MNFGVLLGRVSFGLDLLYGYLVPIQGELSLNTNVFLTTLLACRAINLSMAGTSNSDPQGISAIAQAQNRKALASNIITNNEPLFLEFVEGGHKAWKAGFVEFVETTEGPHSD